MLPLNIGLSVLDNIVHSLSLRTIHQTSSNNEVNISLNIVLGAEMIQELELIILAIVDTGGADAAPHIRLQYLHCL